MKLSKFREKLASLSKQTESGCGMHNCIINPPSGQAPNGGCLCSKHWFTKEIRHLLQDMEAQTQWTPEDS